MSPSLTYFPLRWESTGDQWWYASPIDWAAANGHYDLVRELLRLDSNHLIKLTSLRRLRRLETVWDDDEQFHGAAKCRATVARRLFHHCESKKAGKNSLIRAGYGGWLIYTAASAGDLSFVHELLERNPLLVFGEGEYGVTDVLYAAARSKSCEVFRLLLDYATAPRFSGKGGDEQGGGVGEVPCVYKWEMINRAVHAAARGGNLRVLKELVANCSDVLAYIDVHGSTILHTAAGRGQVEIVKFLIESFETIITSRDHQGNTALHIAAYRGQLAAAEALISALPSSINLKNNAGETFLHKAVSGFQTLQFRRLDRQIELLKKLVRSEIFDIQKVINAKNNEDRTALHAAVIGNVHTDLVQLLMTSDSIDVNVADVEGLTPLDYLKQKPRSASSDVLIRQLISAGAIFRSQDYNARKLIVSRMKLEAGNGGNSPGSSFRISDAEIFLYTGIENVASSEIGGVGSGGGGVGSGGLMSPASIELSPYIADESANFESRRSSFAMFKQVLNWPRLRDKMSSKRSNKNNSIDYDDVPIDYHTRKPSTGGGSEADPPTPLRKRFSKPSSPTSQSNKRTLAVRSNQSSPSSAKKKLRNGLAQITIPRRSSRSSSFSKSSSISSPSSLDKQKGICIEATDIAGPSSSSVNNNNNQEIGNSKRLKSQYYLCFGNGGVSVKSPVNRQQHEQSHNYKPRPVPLVA